MEKLSLNIYDIVVHIVTNSEKISFRLEHDFKSFISQKKLAKFHLSALLVEKIPFERIPKIPSYAISNNCISYKKSGIFFHDYFEQCLVIEDGQSFEIISHDLHKLHEVTYLIILSRTAELMDLMGLHKIHAAGIFYNHSFHLFSMPMKTGKSTLFLNLMKELQGAQAISDDSPVIDDKGRVRAFPLRVGVNSSKETEGLQNLYELHRTHFGVKHLIPIDNFSTLPLSMKLNRGSFYFGIRTRETEPSIEKITKLQALFHLGKHMIIGVGLPQLIEYFIQPNISSWKNKVIILLKRSLAALYTLYRHDFYLFYLCHVPQKNAQFFKEWIENK